MKNTMKQSINLDIYSDKFESVFFDGLTNAEAVYMACDKAVSYCRAQLNEPGGVDVFIEVGNDIRPVYVGKVRIGITRAVSVYRMYTEVMDKVGEIL